MKKENFIYRVFDILSSLLLLILTLPIFIVCSVLIKVNDPKSTIFFKQTRVGRVGELFEIYKFRTMNKDAETQLESLMSQNEMAGPLFKIKNDPRVTSIGKILRKYSLDELPQLVNVLIGNMSLVGPRPPLPSEYLDYTEIEKKRLSVKPGCTGPWQVSGRNAMDFEKMVELDLTYISNRSIWLNINILLKTAKRMTIDADGY